MRTTATNAIAELRGFSEAEMFDIIASLEYFSGAVLVAYQAYMAGPVSGINMMRGVLGCLHMTSLKRMRSISATCKACCWSPKLCSRFLYLWRINSPLLTCLTLRMARRGYFSGKKMAKFGHFNDAKCQSLIFEATQKIGSISVAKKG